MTLLRGVTLRSIDGACVTVQDCHVAWKLESGARVTGSIDVHCAAGGLAVWLGGEAVV
jgi:hypothetical protein